MKTEIKTKLVKVDSVNEAPYNQMEITDEELEGLENSMQRFGCVDLLVLNKRSNNIVGGHQRLKILKKNNVESAKMVIVDLDEIEEKALKENILDAK